MVDANISTPLAIDDIANTSRLKLLERLPQSLGRLFVLRDIADGCKRLDGPAHEKASVGFLALDDGGVDVGRSLRDMIAPGQRAGQPGGHGLGSQLFAAEPGALDQARLGRVDNHICDRHAFGQLPEESVRQQLGGAVLFCGVELQGVIEGHQEGESVLVGELGSQGKRGVADREAPRRGLACILLSQNGSMRRAKSIVDR